MKRASVLLLAAATALIGCGDGIGLGGSPAAPGMGGKDASAPDSASVPDGSGGATETGTIDAAMGDDGSDASQLLPATCLAGGPNSGARWQDLYACYFGPTGIANCALDSSCHVSGPNMAGTWICGPSSDLCYQGLISSGIVPDGGTMSAMLTQFYASLRTSDGFGGNMPFMPTDVSFTPADMMRIATWIQAGAPKN